MALTKEIRIIINTLFPFCSFNIKDKSLLKPYVITVLHGYYSIQPLPLFP